MCHSTIHLGEIITFVWSKDNEKYMDTLFNKPFTFDRVMRIVFGVALIGGLVYLVAL